MAYCAVSVRTESGDDYVFLCEYKYVGDVVAQVHDYLDDELAYVSGIKVDSGNSPELDDMIMKVLWNKVKSLEEK